MALHAENWFPSPIWSGLLNGVDNDAIETFAYDKKTLDPEGVRLSNYIGWQSNSIRYGDNEAFDHLMKTISEEIDACAAQTGLPKLGVQNVWMNINSPGAYNHLHNHAGSILS